MRRRTWLLVGGAAAAGIAGGGLWWLRRFPPDTRPEGAYLRIAMAIGKGRPQDTFAYLEEDAQHAAFTIADYAGRSRELIAQAYPPERQELALAPYAELLGPTDGPSMWVHLAERRGWTRRLRRDLSGIAEVEIAGERATITTARGTRYPFRRRPNGMWGLTLFTAELVAEAERLARDHSVIQQAAADFEREGPAEPGVGNREPE